MYSNVGKFEARKLITEFDTRLIESFGCNMTDARISREDALAAIAALESVSEAVAQLGAARGLPKLRAA